MGFFDISDRMVEEEYQMASFIVHLICCITACSPSTDIPASESSFWVKCLQAPHTLETCAFPATADAANGYRAYGFLPWMSTTIKVFFTECKCGSRTVSSDHLDEVRCISCSEKLDVKKKTVKKEFSCTQESEKDYSSGCIFVDQNQLKDPALAVRQLTPGTFRILQLMVHGTLLGSLALGFSKEDTLHKVMKLPAGISLTDYLRKHLQIHWDRLRCLTQLGHAQMGRFLHFLIDECFDFTLQDRDRECFEREISLKIDQAIRNRFSILQDGMKIYLENKTPAEKECAVEAYIEETDLTINVNEFSPLFWETLPPDAESFRAEYILHPEHQMAYPLIGLVLLKETQLSLLSSLHPILQWHMLTVRMISYHLKKEEAKKVIVHEYIHSLQEKEKKTIFQKRFDAFKKAWSELCSHSQLLQFYNSALPDLKKITNQSSLDQCLSMDSSSVILQVLKALVTMHNEFLDDAIILCFAHNPPCLGFLRRGTSQCHVKAVPLEFVMANQVIHFKLSDRQLAFSQSVTHYGLGRETDYDFGRFEAKFAEALLIGKPYLRLGRSFPLVVFSGEIIQRSSCLLHDVHDIIPQGSIDHELKQAVQELREQNAANLRALLESLEMIMSLLKQTGGQDSDTASHYLETWRALISPPPSAVVGFLKRVKLSQVTALFEFVEGLQAALVGETLADRYCSQLSAEAVDTLEESFSQASLADLEMLLLALRKFAYRYLSSMSADLNDQLCQYLKDPSLWPRASLQGNHTRAMELIPPPLYVEHIHATMTALEKTVENLKRDLEKSWIGGTRTQNKKKSEVEETRRKKKNLKSMRTF